MNTVENEIVECVLDAVPYVEGIYLFGSWGTPYAKPDSDLDIGLLIQKDACQKISLDVELKLGLRLEKIAKSDGVDLLSMRITELYVQYEILSKKRIIFGDSNISVMTYELDVIRSFQEVNAMNKQIYDMAEENGWMMCNV